MEALALLSGGFLVSGSAALTHYDRPEIKLVRPVGQRCWFYRLSGHSVVWRDDKRRIEIPIGFVWDGASVPGALWALLECRPVDLVWPSLLHDFAYREDARQLVLETQQWAPIDRVSADLLLKDAAAHCGISHGDQLRIYYGVRVGGDSSYARKRTDWGKA